VHSLSKSTRCPVRARTHFWPSREKNGIPLYELISPRLRPAKWSFPKQTAKDCAAGVMCCLISVAGRVSDLSVTGHDRYLVWATESLNLKSLTGI